MSQATLVMAAPAAKADAPAKTDADITAESTASSEEATEAEGTGKTLQERVRAVSRRVFLKRSRFELEPLFGFTTNDPLIRAWSFGARGSYHFNEELALDFGGAYAPIQEELKDIRVLGVSKVKLPTATQLLGYADVGVTFSPFYGKLALAAEQVVHFDGFISAGLGAVFDTSPELVHPALELGVGGRMFITRWLTLRADVRNYTYPATVNSQLAFPSQLILNIGAGIFFPLDFDYSNEIIGSKG